MEIIDKIVMEFFPGKKISGYQRGFMKWVMGLYKFQIFTKELSGKHGIDWLRYVKEKFNFKFNVQDSDYNHIPKQGPVIIISNHPTVIDGMALILTVAKVRSDIKIVANHVLTLMLPEIKSFTIGIRNMQGKMGLNQYREMNQHLEKGGVLIICPAGRLARLKISGLEEAPWHSGFLHLARKNNAALVPINIRGANTFLYYLTAAIWRPLSNLMIIRECFRHHGDHLQLTIFPQIDVSKIDFDKKSVELIVASVQEHIQQVAKNKPAMLPIIEPIADPEDRELLGAAIKNCETLKTLSNGKRIVLYRYQGERYSPVLRELGRLREISFREIGAGTGKKYDNDIYDKDYYHILVWDPEQLEIIGAYRFVFAGEQIAKRGISGLYSDSLFKYSKEFLPIASRSVEIGRGFIQKQYQKTNALDELWKGIFNVAISKGEYKYLLGVLTIPKNYSFYTQKVMVGFYQAYLSSDKEFCAPQDRYIVVDEEITEIFSGNNFEEDWNKLKKILRDLGYDLPWPYKQAVKWYSEGGSKILCFIEDDHFNSIAGLNLCEIDKLKKSYGKRYLPQV